MKRILFSVAAALLALNLTACDALKSAASNYSPMVSVGFEVGGQRITVGVAPVPIVRREDPPEALPPVEVIDSK